jgi:histidyl-tRNA synthetase
MASQSTKPARGMRDFLPADVRRRTYVIDVVREVYERYGFEPLETPAVENLETLMGKYGEEGNQLIFPILKRGDQFTASLEQVKQGTGGTAKDLADLALRYDLTVPLARVVAEYRAQLPKFFKRYQIQPVWRADRPARGRFREFYQCDVDICGSKSLIVEAEMCAAVSDVLTRLGFTNFAIRLNHRQLLAAILDVAGVPAERAGDALVALDKLDKIGRDGVLKDMTARQIDEAAANRLLGLFTGVQADGSSAEGSAPVDAASNAATLEKLAAFVGDHAVGKAALDDLRTILAYVTPTSAHGRLAVDPSLARGLSYYTGAIVEVAVSDLAGSLGGGGRYDNLVGMFSNQDVPAAGFSLGLERIIVVMTERGMFPEGLDAAPADVMVTVWNAEKIGDALALARDLRAAVVPADGPGGRRLRVDVYPEADKIGKQFKYAGDRKIPHVVVAGDDELAQGTVTIKNMRTGEQKTVRREAAATALLES